MVSGLEGGFSMAVVNMSLSLDFYKLALIIYFKTNLDLIKYCHGITSAMLINSIKKPSLLNNGKINLFKTV